MKYIEPYFTVRQGKWLHLIGMLQNKLNLDVYPGGYTAMTGWYDRHDGIFNPIVEDLYGTDVNEVP